MLTGRLQRCRRAAVAAPRLRRSGRLLPAAVAAYRRIWTAWLQVCKPPEQQRGSRCVGRAGGRQRQAAAVPFGCLAVRRLGTPLCASRRAQRSDKLWESSESAFYGVGRGAHAEAARLAEWRHCPNTPPTLARPFGRSMRPATPCAPQADHVQAIGAYGWWKIGHGRAQPKGTAAGWPAALGQPPVRW